MIAAPYLLLFGVLALTAQEKSPEPVVRVNLLDNGSFAEGNDSAVDRHGVRPIPWWTSARGMAQVQSLEDGTFALSTIGKDWAEQPIPAFLSTIESFELEVHCRGPGRWTLVDGTGRSKSHDLPRSDMLLNPKDFKIDWGRSLPWTFSKQSLPMPRLMLRLEASNQDSKEVSWQRVSMHVDLPCPAEKDLHAEILALLQEIVAPWLERGLDDLGPRKTGLLCHTFDAVTGKTLTTSPGGFHPLWEQLNAALQVAEVPEWRAAFEHFLEDWLTLCFDPDTGLPRSWDCEKDEPIVDRPAGDLALPLGFLIDVSEKGPERFRDRARAAVSKIAETVLTKGVLPDGTICASYFPADGRANTSVPELRRFDLLAQLARLPQLRTDPRFVRASEELRSAFEFSHVWWGTWDRIDPGFDDEFGNYGARAVSIALADPAGKEGNAFRAIALDGWRHYAPIWRDALRFGGNVAADQVRCCNLLGDLVKVEPSEKGTIAELEHLAARSHFKGEQYGNGAWGDVTIFRFGPRTGLQVGDYTGAPQNLLNGLATVYADDLGGRTEEVRAMYTSVLRSSVKEYRREYGFLLDETQRQGDNPATGTLRMLLGLVKMLRAL